MRYTRKELLDVIGLMQKHATLDCVVVTKSQERYLRSNPSFIPVEQYGFAVAAEWEIGCFTGFPSKDDPLGLTTGVRFFIKQLPRWKP